MPPNSCLCNASFGTQTSLRNHAVQHGHSIRCDCGAFFASDAELQAHKDMPRGICKTKPFKRVVIDLTHQGKNAPNHFWCAACPNKFFRVQDDRVKHLRLHHRACPTCLQVFANHTARDTHQRTTGHCFCSDCDEEGKSFSPLEALAHHQCTVLQIDKYECITCGAKFSNETAFANHCTTLRHNFVGNRKVMEDQQTASAAVQLANVKESNLWCEECKKHFVDGAAYKQHKVSSKHKAPKFAIKCPCKKEFNLVSALVQHLESGGCRSGLTRQKLNSTIYRYDADRRITMDKHADQFAGMSIAGSSTASSIAPSDSASILEFSFRNLPTDSSRPSMVRDRTFTPEDSDATSTVSSHGGVVLTPDSSVYASTDSESINTPPASDTVSTLSGGGARLPLSARSGSSASSSESESMFTPTGSTVSDRVTPSASGSEPVSEVDDEGEGETIFTPPDSSVNGTYEDWSYIHSSTIPTPSSSSIDGSSVATIRYDATSKSWPCSDCSRSFTTRNDLRQHVDSAVHSQEIFHCPTSVGNNAAIRDREFKTMSGLVQHIEDEACKMGEDAMKTLLDVVDKPMRKKFNASIAPVKEQ
jgi:hypothetical protein